MGGYKVENFKYRAERQRVTQLVFLKGVTMSKNIVTRWLINVALVMLICLLGYMLFCVHHRIQKEIDAAQYTKHPAEDTKDPYKVEPISLEEVSEAQIVGWAVKHADRWFKTAQPFKTNNVVAAGGHDELMTYQIVKITNAIFVARQATVLYLVKINSGQDKHYLQALKNILPAAYQTVNSDVIMVRGKQVPKMGHPARLIIKQLQDDSLEHVYYIERFRKEFEFEHDESLAAMQRVCLTFALKMIKEKLDEVDVELARDELVRYADEILKLSLFKLEAD